MPLQELLLSRRVRPLLSNEIFLAILVIVATGTFILYQNQLAKSLNPTQTSRRQSVQKNAGAISSGSFKKVYDSKKSNNSHAAGEALKLQRILTLAKEGPLGDYKTYPCVKGIPYFPKREWLRKGKCVRTITKTEKSESERGNCVPLKTLNGTTPICTYPPEKDVYVSASLHKHGEWETSLVFNIARFLHSHSNVEFLDLGCYIGPYTLAIAHQGTKVTAVDPLLQNLKLLSYSVKLGNLEKYVTLVWHAVSNEHTLVSLGDAPGNIGGTFIQDKKLLSESDMKRQLSRTITLDDLVPLFKDKTVVIKMDMEGSEYKALLGGNQFFNKVNVILIQMEFFRHRIGPDGQNIADFLQSKGLYPYLDLGKHMPLKSSDVSKWSNDVYFLK
ncbi:MAG: FkbM family methyltransferase [Candidatus Thiodiazotropha sp.]